MEMNPPTPRPEARELLLALLEEDITAAFRVNGLEATTTALAEATKNFRQARRGLIEGMGHDPVVMTQSVDELVRAVLFEHASMHLVAEIRAAPGTPSALEEGGFDPNDVPMQPTPEQVTTMLELLRTHQQLRKRCERPPIDEADQEDRATAWHDWETDRDKLLALLPYAAAAR